MHENPMGLASDSASSGADPVASACFRLGWRVEELFSRFEGTPGNPPHAYDLARLPGLSELTSYDWQWLGLDQVDFVVSQVTAKLGTPAAVPLNLTADARSKLEVMTQEEGAALACEEYRTALSEMHVSLLVTLSAADSSYGKAYGLGRALAVISGPRQTPAQLVSSFDSERIGRVNAWLDELASLLPEHATRAVAKSLFWWEQAVAAAHGSSKLDTTLMPANYFGEQVSQWPWWEPAATALGRRRQRTQNSQVDPPSLEDLAVAVVRQGALWRGILDGDKLCIDLLAPQDYLRAGERLAHYNADLVGRVLRTMPWLLFLPLSLGAVIVALLLIPGSAVARTATGVAAFAGTLSGIWKATRARVVPIAMQLERPLWDGELDIATAEAVTIPPVGAPQNPVWQSAEEYAATEVITPAAQAPEAPPPVRKRLSKVSESTEVADMADFSCQAIGCPTTNSRRYVRITANCS